MTRGLLAAALLFASSPTSGPDSAPEVQVKVRHKHLVALCLDGMPIDPGERGFRLAPGAHSFAFTMRNAPRSDFRGAAEVAPGIAIVEARLESGHEYEVEVRAPSSAFSSRVWRAGEWKPVVRDRTGDRIVSSEPEWAISGCEP